VKTKGATVEEGSDGRRKTQRQNQHQLEQIFLYYSFNLIGIVSLGKKMKGVRPKEKKRESAELSAENAANSNPSNGSLAHGNT